MAAAGDYGAASLVPHCFLLLVPDTRLFQSGAQASSGYAADLRAADRMETEQSELLAGQVVYSRLNSNTRV